jgi:hypothetical protein
MKYKRYTLITWEEFEERFKPICNSWVETIHQGVYIDICLNGKPLAWIITNDMIERFGTEIEVEEGNTRNYTHVGDIWCDHYKEFMNYHWHELWFKSDDFIKENEFMI